MEESKNKIPDDWENEIDFTAPDANGIYPIVSAIENGDVDIVKSIIAQGGTVNVDVGDGWTPLHDLFDGVIDGFVQTGYYEVSRDAKRTLKILLENGGDLTIKNNGGRTPLDALNTYSISIEGFNDFKAGLRELLPNIDDLVQFSEEISEKNRQLMKGSFTQQAIADGDLKPSH